MLTKTIKYYLKNPKPIGLAKMENKIWMSKLVNESEK